MEKIRYKIGIILFMTLALSLSATAQDLLQRNFESSMISRGDNHPDFGISKDSANFLLVYLHENIPVANFINDTNLSEEKVNQTIHFLKEKNWLVEKNGKLKPTIFVATDSDGIALFEYAKPISTQIAQAIEQEIPTIKSNFAKMDMAKNQTFEHWAFFIYSNVLLDNWQIRKMEITFLKAQERPERHGKFYFASLMENVNKDSEKFGIFGNQSSNNLTVYGNNRLNISEKDLKTKNIISNSDYQVFEKMAADFLPELVNIFENNKSYIENIYQKSGYSDEITFDEFFIWWYHFIYTQVTNDLADKGLLTIPENGNFVYKLNDNFSIHNNLVRNTVLGILIIVILLVVIKIFKKKR